MSTPQNVTVVLAVDDVDQFPSAEECARDLAAVLDPERFTVTEVTVRDRERVRCDDTWRQP